MKWLSGSIDDWWRGVRALATIGFVLGAALLASAIATYLVLNAVGLFVMFDDVMMDLFSRAGSLLLVLIIGPLLIARARDNLS
jgi:hypothetical protein